MRRIGPWVGVAVVSAVLMSALPAQTSATAAPAWPPTCPSGDACVTLVVSNQNAGVPTAGLYLTLVGTNAATLVAPDGTNYGLNQSILYSTLVPTGGTDAKLYIESSQGQKGQPAGPLKGARIYFSQAAFDATQPSPTAAMFRYDYDEFTIVYTAGTGGAPGVTTVNGDVSGIDQVGIPSSLQFLAPNGTPLNASGSSSLAYRSMGCMTDIVAQLHKTATALGLKWKASSVVRTNGGSFLRLAGPMAMAQGAAGYPDLSTYVQSLKNQTVTISGYYGGNPKTNPPTLPANYSYTGTFDKYGDLALSGTLTDPNGGHANYPNPQTIYLPARGFYETMAPNGNWDANTWGTGASGGVGYATGSGIYDQNGPYQLGGPAPTAFENTTAQVAVPSKSWQLNAPLTGGTPTTGIFYESIGNDVYGWIYGDLIASMGNGFLGPLKYNTSKWNTNKDAAGNPFASPQPAFGAAYGKSPLPTFAAWDLWQEAVSTTSDSYGMPLGDRFNFIGAKSSSPDVSTAANTGIIKITLLPKDGCATGVALAPTPQSLVLTSGQRVDVLAQGTQPPSGVNNDFVTLTGQGFTPKSYSITPALPAGLTFNPTTGVVSGAPTGVMPRTTYAITGTSGTTSASASLTITVQPFASPTASPSSTPGPTASPTPRPTPTPPPAPTPTPSPTTAPVAISPALQVIDAYYGQAMSTKPLSPAGLNYSIGSFPPLPTGLTFNASTGVISGTPSSGGGETFLFVVTGTGPAGTGTANILMTVSSGTPA